MPKPVHEDWSKLSAEMLYRCTEDVRINTLLLNHLQKWGVGNEAWAAAITLEQRVLAIHAQQTITGMKVDVGAAFDLLKQLDTKLNKLESELYDELPDTCVSLGELKAVTLQNGHATHHVKNYFEPLGIDPLGYWQAHGSQYPDTKEVVRIGGPFTRISFEPVNLNSHPKVKDLLLSLGWRPTEWNHKRLDDGSWKRMSPKLTEDSYDSLPPGVGQKLGEYLATIHKRRFV